MISIATHWNDYLWPLIITDTDDVRTLTIGLGMFVQFMFHLVGFAKK